MKKTTCINFLSHREIYGKGIQHPTYKNAFWGCLLFLLSASYSVRGQQAVTEMSRYIAGNGNEFAFKSKNIGGFTYILGTTSSTNLEVTNGSSFKGVRDIYVAKLNSLGNILFASYLGGSANENLPFTVNFEVIGNDIYFLFDTQSADLPVTNGTVSGGGQDIGVAKINSLTGTIEFCTYYGGSGSESIADIKVNNGDVYIAGSTSSVNLPVTNGTTFQGVWGDLAIARLNGNSGNIIWSTYYGGNGNDIIANIEVSGNTVFVGGSSSSNTASFPSTDGTLNQGQNDFFYARLNATNGNSDFLTFLGGTENETIKAFKVVAGEAYLLGSSSSKFATTNGSVNKGGADVFMVKYNSGNGLAYSTLIGGELLDQGLYFDIVNGYVYFAGTTGSLSYPVTNGTAFGGGLYDIALTKLSTSGNVMFSTFLGTSFIDAPNDIKVGCDDNVYVLGVSSASGYPTTNASDYAPSGYNNVLTKINCTTGQLLFSSYFNTNASGSGTISLLGNGVVEFFGSTNGWPGFPVTLPNYSAATGHDFVLARFNTCPSGFTGNTAVTPAVQNICANGIAGLISMEPAILPGSSQPLQYITGVPTVPADIPANKYQWQIAATFSGPWTNVPGAITQNFTPSNQAADRYYRRLAVSVCCGVATTTQIGDVASIIISNTAPTVNAGGPFATCAGISVTIGGSPTAVPAAGNSIVSYLWSPAGAYTPGNAVANPTVSPAVSTLYNVLVTDNFGCQQIGQAMVNVYAADAGPDKSTCSNQPVRIGSVPIVGVPGVTYSWAASPVDPSMSCTNCAQPDVSPSVPTTYTLTITVPVSGGGTCTTTDAVVVSVVNAPTNNTGAFGGPDVTVCYGGNALLGTTAESGFTYTWAPGNYLSLANVARPAFQPGSLNFPDPNPFSFFVTAAKGGCVFIDSVRAYVIKANAGIDVCGPALIGTPDGTPNINETYSWTKITAGAGTSNFLGATNTAQVPVSSSTVATTFRLSVTFNGVTCTDDVVVSSCGCSIPSIKIISSFDCANYDINNGYVMLIAKTTSPSTFTWSPAAGLSASTGDTVYLTDNVARTYTVTATSIYDNSSFCSNSIDVNNPVAVKPIFNAQDVTVCPGNGVNIGQTTVAGYSYQWSNAYGLNSTTVSNPLATVTSTTDYYVIVTDIGSGCTIKDTSHVAIYNLPSNVAGNNITLCGSGIAQLGVNPVPGVTYLWTPAAAYNPSNAAPNPTVPVSATTTFFVTAINTAGGCTVNGSVTVTVNAAVPGFSFPDQNFCPDVAGSLPMPSGPAGMTIYNWTPVNLVVNPASNGPIATTLVTRPSAITTYTLTVYDAAGCSNKASVRFVPSVSVPDAGSDKLICLNAGPVSLGNPSAPTGSGIIYNWSPATGLSSTSIPNPVFTPTVAGTTIYTLTKTEGGCSTTDVVRVTVQDYTLPAIPAQTVCQNSCVQIGITPKPGETYSWSPATGLSNLNIANPVACPTTSVTYRLTATGVNGCVATSDVLLNVSADLSPVVSIIPINTCLGSSAGERFNPVITPAGAYSYFWSPADGYLSNVYMSNPFVYPASLGTKTYNLNVINQATGCATQATGTITVYNCAVVPVLLKSFTAITQGENVLLNWVVNNEENQAVYEVQFSEDGRFFIKAGSAIVTGSSRYSLLHELPATRVRYYRLKLIAKDGSLIYSPVRKISPINRTGILSIYPNPTNDIIHILIPHELQTKSATISIYSADGRLHLTKKIEKTGVKETLITSMLRPGIYNVSVKGNRHSYTSTIIVIK